MSEGETPDDQPEAAPNGAAPAEHIPAGDIAAGGRACTSCGAPLAADQDWCLHCGAGKTVGRSGPGWRSAAAAIGAATVLALGAAAAAYAAFKGEATPAGTPASTVAQTPPATTSTTTTSTTTVPPVSSTTPTEPLPSERKPPKIPGTASTPQTGGTTSELGGGSSSQSTTESGSSTEGQSKRKGKTTTEKTESKEETCSSSSTEEAEAGSEEAAQTEGESTDTATGAESEVLEDEEACTGQSEGGTAPIPLAAHDASTYDPNGYPESGYVDPQLAIDGNASTAWTAAPGPEIAPKVQAGLLIAFGREREIAKVALISRALGMTVQVYGTTQRVAPKSLESKAWVKLSGVHIVEERSSKIKLKRTPKIRQLLVWVLRAPEIEPKVEGEVVEDSAAINELTLYAPS